VLRISKKLDTSWFDLKNYDKVKELDLREWHFQLSMRKHLLTWKGLGSVDI
jgi:hypothetical protein